VSTRTVHLLLLVALSGIALAVALVSPPYERHTEGHQPDPALAYVPAGAQVVITVDVARLRETTLGSVLAVRGRELPQVGKIEPICGFDPTERIDSLLVSVPSAADGDSDSGEVGIVVFGDFSASRIVSCAGAVIGHRGGESAVTRIGTFTTVRDRRDAASGEVAIRDGGPAILGGGSYFRDLLDVADARGKSVASTGVHAALRHAVDPTSDGAVVTTWIPNPRRPALADESGGQRWAALRGLALRVDVQPEIDLELLLVCSPEMGCKDLAEAVRRTKRSLTSELRAATGLDLERVDIDEKLDRIELTLRLSPSEAQVLIDRLIRFGPSLAR